VSVHGRFHLIGNLASGQILGHNETSVQSTGHLRNKRQKF